MRATLITLTLCWLHYSANSLAAPTEPIESIIRDTTATSAIAIASRNDDLNTPAIVMLAKAEIEAFGGPPIDLSNLAPLAPIVPFVSHATSLEEKQPTFSDRRRSPNLPQGPPLPPGPIRFSATQGFRIPVMDGLMHRIGPQLVMAERINDAVFYESHRIIWAGVYFPSENSQPSELAFSWISPPQLESLAFRLPRSQLILMVVLFQNPPNDGSAVWAAGKINQL